MVGGGGANAVLAALAVLVLFWDRRRLRGLLGKPSGKPARIYGAREIKELRREPSLMKEYLSGELGAVPHVG